MGYSVTFMLVVLMQTYLFLYGGSYLCNVTHDLIAVMGILIIFSSLFDTIAVHGFPGHVSNIKGIYMPWCMASQGMYQTSKGNTWPQLL